MSAEGLSGKNGAVYIEGNRVASMRSWRWSRRSNTVNTAGFGDDYEKAKPSVKSGTGSFQGIWAKGDAVGQGAVEDAYENDTLVTLNLELESGKVNSLEAYITELEVGAEYEGVTNFNATFSQWGSPNSIADHS